MIKLGDCLEGLRALPDNSVDSIVTDPPYGLKFMGKAWDYDVPPEEVWRECLRVLKPGGHLLCFAGTRTQHRMAVRIEDAGFEIRDMIAWVYGSGFPKSADVSKHLDAHERKTWLDVAKAIGNADKTAMLTAWKEHSKTASGAGLSFVKSETATGTNMQKSGSAPESVLLQANPESNDAIALVAELSLTVAHRTNGVSCSSVQSPAEKSTTGLRGHATSAESRHASREAILDMLDSSALQNAWGWQDESMVDKLKAVEVLKIWLGRKKSSDAAATSVLCAALTDDLKHIILSQSKTYRDAGTIQQTAFASAITATITESTAESLISFMVDTLRSKAIDKAAGAEREVVGSKTVSRDFTAGEGEDIAFRSGRPGQTEVPVTAAATDAARQWEGWGTALKPALEPITVARKPLAGTVAANVLAHGTGALNIDGCRVEGGARPLVESDRRAGANGTYGDGLGGSRAIGDTTLGRWPANLIHDGSDEVVALFPESSTTGKRSAASRAATVEGTAWLADNHQSTEYTDSGSAARFFKQIEVTDAEWLENLSPALIAGSNLSLSKLADAIARSDAVTSALPEGRQLSVLKAPSTSVTPSESKLIATSVITAIRSIASASLLAQQPERLSLSHSHVSVVAHQTQTGTMTITASLSSSAGCAESITFSITPKSLAVGEKGCEQSSARFMYCAKASKRDRDEGLEGFAKTSGGMVSNTSGQHMTRRDEGYEVAPRANNHPTVKPTDLMRYLCRLVTPPGGLVLDPYTGSGSTAKAAALEGFRFIGFEIDPDYHAIAERRWLAAIGDLA